MVKINKTQPAPGHISCSEDYRQGAVFDTICKDFYSKCYLCEDTPTAINIEHIVPHKGDVTLKFKWENLFLACSHCNNTKGAGYDDIIDCTKDDPEDTIHFMFKCLPMKEPEFALRGVGGSPQDIRTVELLKKVFCKPTTDMKSKEAIELCKRLYKEVKEFLSDLEKYFYAVEVERNEEKRYIDVADHLDRCSPFAAFKRAIARDEYLDHFGEELEK